MRKHAWQLSFAIDARRAFRNGLPVGQGQPLFTRWFEPVYDLLTDNPVGRLLATLLLYLWFLCTGVWLRTQEKT